MPAHLFTIFIPTYNRAKVLARALESVQQQTFRNFDVVIIDDGSTDDTEQLVSTWIQASGIPTTYVKQENQGRHVAHNTALHYLTGELMVLLDSDDLLEPDALDTLARQWHSIADKSRYAGVEGMAKHLDGEVEGDFFPRDPLDCSFREMRLRYRIRGDKRGAIRSDILKRFPYPVFAGERHIKPSIVFNLISREYIFRYINDIIEVKEHQPGGLSDNRFRLRMRNPKGFRECYRQEINLYDDNRQPKAILHNYINYIRYSLHAGLPLARLVKDVRSPWLTLFILPLGYAKYRSDRARLRKGDAGKNA